VTVTAYLNIILFKTVGVVVFFASASHDLLPSDVSDTVRDVRRCLYSTKW
jgi:hypothetical protein